MKLKNHQENFFPGDVIVLTPANARAQKAVVLSWKFENPNLWMKVRLWILRSLA